MNSQFVDLNNDIGLIFVCELNFVCELTLCELILCGLTLCGITIQRLTFYGLLYSLFED